jgi:hypothetical protein
MRKITIVGAGQAGLQLGISLQRLGYGVRVVTDRTPPEVQNGKVLSSQLMFGEALSAERHLSLNFWDDVCPPYTSFEFTILTENYSPGIKWTGLYQPSAQSVDQRLKIPRWMIEFNKCGGNFIFKEVNISDLELFAAVDDLVIVATGRRDFTNLFELDVTRSPFSQPMRISTMIYAYGISHVASSAQGGLVVVPDIGEIVWLPAITLNGPCHIIGFGAVPGGPIDLFHDSETLYTRLSAAKRILKRYVPWYADRWQHMELTDPNGILTAAVTPAVRNPIGRLPSGRAVLGMGDAVLLNDPIAAQGSNNAAKTAELYKQRIITQGDRPFDVTWMLETFEACWKELQWSVELSNTLLLPIPPHIRTLFGAAQQSHMIRQTIMNGFNRPQTLFPWIKNSLLTERFIKTSYQMDLVS